MYKLNNTKQPINPAALSAIFFDFGKVLVDFDWNYTIERLARCNGGERDRIEQFLRDPLHVEFELGRVTEYEFYLAAREKTGITCSFDQFVDAWNNIFTPIPETIALAEQLAELLPLWLVSNTNPLHVSYIEQRFEFLKSFRERFYSPALGARKPDPALYRQILERAKVQPHQALLIDDRQENVEGARAVGMQALHVPDRFCAKEELIPLLHSLSRRSALKVGTA